MEPMPKWAVTLCFHLPERFLGTQQQQQHNRRANLRPRLDLARAGGGGGGDSGHSLAPMPLLYTSARKDSPGGANL